MHEGVGLLETRHQKLLQIFLNVACE